MAKGSAKKVAPTKLAPTDYPPANNAELAQRLSQVQTLLFGDAERATADRIAFLEDRVRELEQSAKERFDNLTSYVDRLTTEMAKTADKRFADLERDLETLDRRQTQQRRRMVSTLGESIKGLAKEA